MKNCSLLFYILYQKKKKKLYIAPSNMCNGTLTKPKPQHTQSYNLSQMQVIFLRCNCRNTLFFLLLSYTHNLPHKGIYIEQKSKCRQGKNPSMQESHAIAFNGCETKIRHLTKS